MSQPSGNPGFQPQFKGGMTQPNSAGTQWTPPQPPSGGQPSPDWQLGQSQWSPPQVPPGPIFNPSVYTSGDPYGHRAGGQLGGPPQWTPPQPPSGPIFDPSVYTSGDPYGHRSGGPLGGPPQMSQPYSVSDPYMTPPIQQASQPNLMASAQGAGQKNDFVGGMSPQQAELARMMGYGQQAQSHQLNALQQAQAAQPAQPSFETLLGQANGTPVPKAGGNIFGQGPVPTFPGDPRYPGYKPGDGWRIMQDQYKADPNNNWVWDMINRRGY